MHEARKKKSICKIKWVYIEYCLEFPFDRLKDKIQALSNITLNVCLDFTSGRAKHRILFKIKVIYSNIVNSLHA
jgi:hypothetical protein